jgi:hypothetical protein
MDWMIRQQNKFPSSHPAPAVKGARMKLPSISLIVVVYTLHTTVLICYAESKANLGTGLILTKVAVRS